MLSTVIHARRARWFMLLILPWLAGALIFHIAPIFGVFTLAFMDWSPPALPRLAGLTHIRSLQADPLFWRTLINSAIYTAGSVAGTQVIGLGLALLLNHRPRISRLYPALFFLPAAINGVATTLMWGWIFNPRYGMVNRALHWIGLQGPAWLQDENWAMLALILVSLWGSGASMLVYLGALQSIPAELKEAAVLDGAGYWWSFRYVVWPLLTPVTLYLLVANSIGSFQVFTPFYLLTQGGPNFSTLTLPLYIYINAFSWGKMGYASALAISLFLLLLILTGFQLRLARGWIFYLGQDAH